MSRQEVVEYVALQLAGGYDALTVLQQLRDYGCTAEEAQELLAEAGVQVTAAAESPRVVSPVSGKEKGKIHSLYRGSDLYWDKSARLAT